MKLLHDYNSFSFDIGQMNKYLQRVFKNIHCAQLFIVRVEDILVQVVLITFLHLRLNGFFIIKM
jgi:hypothetical protein